MGDQRTTLRRSAIALLIATAFATLIAACVSVGIERCGASSRSGLIGGTSFSESALLLLSAAAAVSAVAFILVPRLGQRDALAVFASAFLAAVVGGVWFVISMVAFYVAELGHCPIGPF